MYLMGVFVKFETGNQDAKYIRITNNTFYILYSLEEVRLIILFFRLRLVSIGYLQYHT